MPLFIAFYRGINVVGKNLVKMQFLCALHERLGHRNVKNYIQSGNIVFSANGSANMIAKKILAEFGKEFGFSPKLIVLDAKQLGSIVKANPYAKFAAANPKTVHAGICAGDPSKAALQTHLSKTGGTESFAIGKGVVYLHAPDGFGTSKFAAGMEKACGVPMTVRNWRTIDALLKMVGA